MNNFMTLHILVGLTKFMTTKRHSVIRGRDDLLHDHKGQVDL